MKIINIEGFESHLFKECSSLLINYKKKTIGKSNNNFNYSKNFNNHRLNLKFEAINSIIDEKKQILDQKYEDLTREDKSHKILPFKDKNAEYVYDYKEVTQFHHNYGLYDGNEVFLELDSIAFNDRPNLNLKEFVSLTEEEIQDYIYPIRFNESSYHRRGGKIDIFNVINNITLSTFGVDKVRGIRGFATSNSMNALKENIKIENYFTRKEEKSFPFEDGILEGYLYNNNAKKIIEKIDFEYNPITKEKFNVTAKIKQINKISTEPRFVQFEAQKITPFNDISPYSNNTTIQNDSQIYLNKLIDNELNDILLANKKEYDVLSEERIYASTGKIIDYSASTGIESLFFHESID